LSEAPLANNRCHTLRTLAQTSAVSDAGHYRHHHADYQQGTGEAVRISVVLHEQRDADQNDDARSGQLRRHPL